MMRSYQSLAKQYPGSYAFQKSMEKIVIPQSG